MISLTVVIVILSMTFGGAYLIYRMNRHKQVAHPMRKSSPHHH